MHPRQKRVAVDGSDDVDGVMQIRIAGLPPNGLGVARRLAIRRVPP